MADDMKRETGSQKNRDTESQQSESTGTRGYSSNQEDAESTAM